MRNIVQLLYPGSMLPRDLLPSHRLQLPRYGCNVSTLLLKDNLFSGCLPSTIGKLNKLWTLVVRNNQLSGRVRTGIGAHTECPVSYVVFACVRLII